MAGSPPLTRGPLVRAPSEAFGVGITPAHAGTTFASRSSRPRSGDHPRSRGDHIIRQFHIAVYYGSPPLTRGPQDGLRMRSTAHRITPAHAGTPRGCTSARLQRRDHPRSRGEHAEMRSCVSVTRGSPPLTRGPLARATITRYPQRITPAHAGTTSRKATMSCLTTDHPRSRGDHRAILPLFFHR